MFGDMPDMKSKKLNESFPHAEILSDFEQRTPRAEFDAEKVLEIEASAEPLNKMISKT